MTATDRGRAGGGEEGVVGRCESPSPADHYTAQTWGALAGLRRTMGMARDGIAAASPVVAAGYAAAHNAVDAGFGITKSATSSVPVVGAAVDAAHSITSTSLRASAYIAHASLGASDRALSFAGGETGETYRTLERYVRDSYSGEERELREALLGLAALLVEVGGEFGVHNPLRLMRGAAELVLLHGRERAGRIAERRRRRRSVVVSPSMTTADSERGSAAAVPESMEVSLEYPKEGPPVVIPNAEELSSLSRHMRFAAAAYGAQAAAVAGMILNRDGSGGIGGFMMSDENAIANLTGIAQSDILRLDGGRRMYQPAHFVALDRAHEEVVVAIRGTMSMHDVLVDLVCRGEKFVTVYDKDHKTIEGKVHGGFLKSAQRLANDLHELVATALRDHPTYRLAVVGHSLGGGVGTVLALLWAMVPSFSQRDVRAIAYAAPCSLCALMARSPYAMRHITSIVTGDDVVSRLSLGSFLDLQRATTTLSILGGEVTDEERAEIIRKLPKDEQKLYCGGRVWWMESEEHEPHPIVEVDPVEEFDVVGLFPDMFGIHMPKAYLDSLDKLEESL